MFGRWGSGVVVVEVACAAGDELPLQAAASSAMATATVQTVPRLRVCVGRNQLDSRMICPAG